MYQYKEQMLEHGLPSQEFGCNFVTTISYNVHSAMSEPRLEAVLKKLSSLQWDIVILVETWRETRTERVCISSKTNRTSPDYSRQLRLKLYVERLI